MDEVLKLWGDAAEGFCWYLYRETLLCANGLDAFPEALQDAQVVIPREARNAAEQAAKRLCWNCEKTAEQLRFRDGERLVLTVEWKDGLEAGGTVFCGGADYPVFAGWQTYLADAYGDYETGLTDEFGVGLTAEEKVELKQH